jgi:hypothetical protein
MLRGNSLWAMTECQSTRSLNRTRLPTVGLTARPNDEE